MTWQEFPKWVDGPAGPVIVRSLQEERAITGAVPVARDPRAGNAPAEALPAAEVRLPPRSPGAWQPGRPIRTEQDEAEWRAWRRERILDLQRYRRSRMRRIDYYASHEAVAIIDRLRTPRAGGDASSIVNQIIHEWATRCGVPELNRGK
jgi:hypothetical protein